MALRTRSLHAHASLFLRLLLQLVRSSMHYGQRLVRRCMQEWRDIVLLKMELYRKVSRRR